MAYGALAMIPAMLVGAGASVFGLMQWAPILSALLILIMPVIAARRRLNDLDYSSWLALLALIPYLNLLVALWLAVAKGNEGPNEYGPAPGPNNWGVVVIAIVLPLALAGILAAIAIPAYQSYTARARAAQRSSAPPSVQESSKRAGVPE